MNSGSITEVVVFDTCMVRGVIHNHDDSIQKLTEMSAYKLKVSFRIGDTALSELCLALLDDRLPWNDWSDRIAHINNILDPNLPVLPGGRELTTLVDPTQSVYPQDIGGTEYWKAAWQLIADARSDNDIIQGREFTFTDGTVVRIRATKETAQAVFDDERTKWAKYFESMQSLLSGSHLTQQQIISLIRKGLDTNGTEAPPLSSQYDAMVCSLGRFIYLSLNGQQPYNPRSVKRDGDPFDFSLLHALPLPARICTKDKRFKSHVDLSSSTQSDRVMLPEQLLEWLRGL
jgi:hypothetical protein